MTFVGYHAEVPWTTTVSPLNKNTGVSFVRPRPLTLHSPIPPPSLCVTLGLPNQTLPPPSIYHPSLYVTLGCVSERQVVQHAAHLLRGKLFAAKPPVGAAASVRNRLLEQQRNGGTVFGARGLLRSSRLISYVRDRRANRRAIRRRQSQ